MSTQKRISAPRTYNIKRKVSKWITRVSPGPHDKNALPLNVFLRDIINVVRNKKEAKTVLNQGKVLVDGKTRKSPNFPVGFLDIVSLPLKKAYYRITYDNIGRLYAFPITKKEAGLKIVKIKKKMRKAKTYQLTTNDGRTFITSLRDGKKYKTRDSLLIKIPSQEIIKHLPFKQGATSFITRGRQVGQVAIIKEIKEREAVLVINKKQERTVKDYVFVIGDKTGELKVNE